MSDFEKEIDEVICVVRDGQRLPRKKCYFVSDAEMRQLRELKKASVQMSREEPDRQTIIMRAGNILAPVCISLTWVLGAAEGLADPLFAGISVAVCALWAVCNVKWGAFNA